MTEKKQLRQQAESQLTQAPDASAALTPEEARRTLHELQVHQIELEMQNEELRRTQAELDLARARYFDLYDLAPVGYCTLNENGLILEANLTAATLLGVTRSALVKQPLSRFIFTPDQDTYYRHRNALLAGEKPQTCELRLLKPDGTPFWAHLTATTAPAMSLPDPSPGRRDDNAPTWHVVLSDVTEHHLQEEERELTARLIIQVSAPGDFRASMAALTASLQGWSGCEAVGIRLQAGDDYPYYETRGFPPAFVHQETHLCARDADGKVRRDAAGRPILECMCGNVLAGRTDPAQPFFTAHGSFWSNSTTALLAGTTDADRQAPTRNQCNAAGYESVALIPLRAGPEVFGLLQFNDRRANRFTPDTITHFERMAEGLAMALAQRQAVEALRESDQRFRTLATVAPVGIYLATPDGRCQYTNPAWCEMAGLSAAEALGAGWAAALHPDDRERVFAHWAQTVATRDPWELEYRFQTRTGKVTWVYGLATPQYDAAGNLTQYVGVNLDITERRGEDEIVRFLAQTSSGPGAEPFFNVLARYLAHILQADFICIDRLEGDGLNARTVAVWCDGRFEDNVTYALKDTPCGNVVGKTVCCFPASVCQFFPRDQVLRELRAESYVGVTLWSHTGQPIGLIAVVGRQPLANRTLAEASLKLVAVRAAGELERQQAEETLTHKYDEIERFNRVTVDRELRMIELKQEINALLTAAGHPPKYKIVTDTKN